MRNKLVLTIFVVVSIIAIAFILKGVRARLNTNDIIQNSRSPVFLESGLKDKKETGVIPNEEFRVFRESDCKNRRKNGQAVFILLNKQYKGKCSKKDIVAWLGNDFVKYAGTFGAEGLTSNSVSSVKTADISYLTEKKQLGVISYESYLELGFDDKDILDFVSLCDKDMIP
jgi:hypothetical protein